MSNPRLSIIPAGAVTDRSLEPRDLQVLCKLGCHTDSDSGWCRRSQVKMAKELDCGRSSVQRSLDRLVEAGWVEKKRPPWSAKEGQPSHSYMYRVILDRDDAPAIAPQDDPIEDDESYAQDASQEGECPPVGTPPAQHDGHPGAQPYVGTGAQPYVGTKNDPLERPPIERERDARARAEKTARFLVDFEKRWPTAAADDRQRTAYAAEALTDEEQAAALAGIAPFLDNLKRLKRTGVPAGWKYLEEKRWTLLEQQQAATGNPNGYPRDSLEAKAIMALFHLAGAFDFFVKVIRKNDVVYYRHPLTPQLLKLADAPPREEWLTANRRQAGSWNSFLDKYPTISRRNRLIEGDKIPFEWAPGPDGKLYTATATGPPLTELSEQDMADFR